MIDYRPVIDNIASQQLLHRVAIPDEHLMIGAAEHLAPVGGIIYQKISMTPPKPMVMPSTMLSKEDVDPNFEAANYSNRDFSFGGFYLGGALNELGGV